MNNCTSMQSAPQLIELFSLGNKNDFQEIQNTRGSNHHNQSHSWEESQLIGIVNLLIRECLLTVKG